MATKWAVRPTKHERNKDRAGQTWATKGETVRYGDDGRVTAIIRDRGRRGREAGNVERSAHSNDSAAHRGIYELAKAGKWDEAGVRANQALGDTSNATLYTAGDFSKASEYMNELANEFGYNARDYYKGKYDSIYGKGMWDNPDHNGSVAKALEEQGFDPKTGTFSGNSSVSGVTTGGGQPSSIEGYLRQLYRDKADAQEAALRSAFDTSMAGYEANDGKIGQMYDERRRQAEGANDLQRMSMNELGIAQGLNTGATGQLALGQSQAYQGMLGDLFAQENADRAANDLLMRQLEARFNANLAKSQASNNADLTQALINEMIRQAEANTAAEKWAQEQANWQAEFDAAQKRHDDELALAYAQLAAKGRSGGGGHSSSGRSSGGGGDDGELLPPPDLQEEGGAMGMDDNSFARFLGLLKTQLGVGGITAAGELIGTQKLSPEQKIVVQNLVDDFAR